MQPLPNSSNLNDLNPQYNDLRKEILALTANLPDGAIRATPRKRRVHNPALTYHQKIKATAIGKREAQLNALNAQLVILHRERSKHVTFDETVPNRGIPVSFNNRLRALKQKITTCQYFLSRHRDNPAPLHLKPAYKAGKFYLKQKTQEYDFFFGLISHEYAQWRRFMPKEQFPEPIMTSYYDKEYPASRKKAWWRIDYLFDELTKKSDGIYLEPPEAKWLIKHLQTVAKRLERDRAINYTLRRPRADFNDNTLEPNARRKSGETVYSYPSLEEIYYTRSMKYLMTWFGYQIKEDERDLLVKVALELREHLIKVFSVS